MEGLDDFVINEERDMMLAPLLAQRDKLTKRKKEIEAALAEGNAGLSKDQFTIRRNGSDGRTAGRYFSKKVEWESKRVALVKEKNEIEIQISEVKRKCAHHSTAMDVDSQKRKTETWVLILAELKAIKTILDERLPRG